MKKKRSHVLIAVGLIVFLSTLVLFALPYFANTFLLPRIIGSPANNVIKLNISRISPFSLDANFEVRHDDKPLINLPAISLSFSPRALINKRFDKLHINGGTFHLQLIEKSPIFPPADATTKKKDSLTTQPLQLPFTIDSIAFNNCTLFVHHQDQPASVISLDGALTIDYPTSHHERDDYFDKVSVTITTSGDLTSEASLALNNKLDHYTLSFQTMQNSASALVQSLLPDTARINYDSFSFMLDCELDKKSLKPTDINGSITAQGLVIESDNYSLAFADDLPIAHLTGDAEKLQYEIFSLFCNAPVPLLFKSKGDISFGETINGSGNYQIIDNRKNSTKKSVIDGSYIFKKTKNDSLSANISLAAVKPVTFDYMDKQVEITSLASEIAVVKKGESFKTITTSTIESLNISASNQQLLFNGFETESEFTLNNNALKGEVNTSISEIVLPKQITLQDVSLKLPLKLHTNQLYPVGEGSFTIDKIFHTVNHIASFNSKLIYSNKEARLSALVSTPLQDDLAVEITGISDYTHHILTLTIPETQLHSATFASYLNIPDDLEFDGKLSAEAVINSEGTSSTATLNLNDINISIPENKVYLSNLNTQLHIVDLIGLRSKPSQHITVGQMDLGTIRLEDADIRYRLEEGGNIFIEKSQLNWCNGKVESGSFSVNQKSLDTTLYCDRLDFAQLLAQFGIEGVQGTGSLNGKIPIHLSESGVFFNNGFMFSTPGKSSTLKFSNTQLLQSAMQQAPQTATLDYSLLALKNFSYDWSRLTFTSENEELTLKMALQGKPTEPLPFRYQSGQIVHSPEGPGIRHPLRLNLNFNLPQENIFKLGKKLQTIKENL